MSLVPAPDAFLASSSSSLSCCRPGWGWRSASAWPGPAACASSRSTPSSRRISVRPARAVSPISSSRCAPAAGIPGVASRAVSACTAIIEMWCATTSCSSRAMRARSPRAVCSSRVPATACRAALCTSASLRARCAIPARAAAGASAASSTTRTSFLGTRVPGIGQRQHQERHGQGRRQELGRIPRGSRFAGYRSVLRRCGPAGTGRSARGQARDRQRLEGRERKHARRADSHGGRDRPEERPAAPWCSRRARHTPTRPTTLIPVAAPRAIASVIAASPSRAPATAGACGTSANRRPSVRVHRGHPPRSPAASMSDHCRRSAWVWRHPGRGYRRPSCEGWPRMSLGQRRRRPLPGVTTMTRPPFPSLPGMEATIEVSGLRKRFGPTLALDGMSFTVAPGPGDRLRRPERRREVHHDAGDPRPGRGG